jgi:hypothetical protein
MLDRAFILAAVGTFAIPLSEMASAGEGAGQENRDPCEIFEQIYSAWREELRRPTAWSTKRAPVGFHAMVQLGPKCVPLIFGKLGTTTDNVEKQELVAALGEITQKYFGGWTLHREIHGNAQILVELYAIWWERGRLVTSRDFDVRFARWKHARASSDLREIKESWNDIRDMGIDIYPLLVEKIRAGDNDLVPMIAAIAREPIAGDPATRQSVLEWWSRDADKWTLPPPGKIEPNDEGHEAHGSEKKELREGSPASDAATNTQRPTEHDPLVLVGIAIASALAGGMAGAGLAILIDRRQGKSPPAQVGSGQS